MSNFSLTFHQHDLSLRQPFTIARGTKKVVHNVFLTLSHGVYTGIGEAAPNPRYNEDADKVCRFLQQLPPTFFDDITSPEGLHQKIKEFSCPLRSRGESVQSAKAALEMAWLDWWGKSQHQPLWKLWDAPQPTGPATSYTIGLDELDVMQQKVQDAPHFPVYKVKLGTNRDRAIIRAIREVTDTPIRVDANEGWTTLEQAKQMVAFLADHNIELIEQPMPSARFESQKKLHDYAPIPICADESFMGPESLAEISEAFDIINIKLMKIGSLVQAKGVIEQAHTHDLQVMIGCMIESSVAIAAGTLLSLWADYADLDGHLLIKQDPATGLALTDHKKIKLSEKAGLGVAWMNLS